MINLIREILANYLDKIDSGNSNITEKEQGQILDFFAKINRQELSATEAYNYLGVSKSTFYNYIDKGLIPKGTKEAGKQPYWNKQDLEKFLKSE